MKKCIFILIIFYYCQPIYAQFTLRYQVASFKPTDSLDIQYYSKKKFWTAAGMVFSLNMGVWAFDRYALDADFAKIDATSVQKNLTKGFRWDNDQMSTNMFFHPYHGNLYYNSARSNGYNYWASGAFAFCGSAMWELFMETESPSYNDIISTPVGGMAIGEVFYRTSDLFVDDKKTGWNRFGREVGVFLLDPTRGLSRILSGDAWRRRSSSGRQFGTPMISIDISTGIRTLELRDEILDEGIGLATEVSMEYGDKYDHDNVKPYDFFSFRANLNVQGTQPLIGQVNIIGQLWGKAFDFKNHYLGVGIYQHFDYYDSDTLSTTHSTKTPYKFGTPASVGIGFYHQNTRFSNWHFDSFGHLNIILIGASLSDYYLVDNRNYNLGNGFGWKGGVNLSFMDDISLSFLFEGYRLYTHKGYPEGYDLTTAQKNDLNAQGDKSVATFNTTSLIFSVKLAKQFYITSSISAYKRTTDYYSQFPKADSFTGEGKLMITYKL